MILPVQNAIKIGVIFCQSITGINLYLNPALIVMNNDQLKKIGVEVNFP